MKHFKYAVIGRGLFGSAAARYLAVESNDVVVIGPDEPKDWKKHSGVFASHYDQGRITRTLDSDPLWATLAQRSISRYKQIENESEIKFFFDVGFLRLAPVNTKGQAYLQTNVDVANQINAPILQLNNAQLQSKFPFLNFNCEYAGLFESYAGYINPRDLVQAQLRIADKKGATELKETVSNISADANRVLLSTYEGNTYTAERCLIANGAYANLLLDSSLKKLDYIVRNETVLLAEVSSSVLESLKGMPSFICLLESNNDFDYVYVLPPISYPDRKTYIKIGGNREGIIDCERAALENWFHSDGDATIGEKLAKTLRSLLPALAQARTITKPCIFTTSSTGHPFLAELMPNQIYVAAGCCGGSAKSSDEIGRLAAQLTMGYELKGFEPHSFKTVFA